MNLRRLHAPPHQCPQKQGDGAVESVHPDLRVGPVVHGPPVSDGAILHLLEYILDEELTAIGFDNAGIIPRFPITYNDVLAQVGVSEFGERRRINGIVELRDLSLPFADARRDDLFCVPSAQDPFALFLYRCQGRGQSPLNL